MSAVAHELRHPSVREVLGRSDYAIISQIVEPNTASSMSVVVKGSCCTGWRCKKV